MQGAFQGAVGQAVNLQTDFPRSRVLHYVFMAPFPGRVRASITDDYGRLVPIDYGAFAVAVSNGAQ